MVNSVELSEIALLLNGDRSSNYPSDADFISYGVPFVNTGHLSDGKIDYSRVDYISKAKANSLSGAKIVAEDILLCLRGTLGKYAFVEKDGGAPASSLVVIRANKDKIVPRFLYYVVSSNIFQHQILIENNGSSQPNLSAKSVMGFRVPFPTKKEQQAVSNVLSDIDALIENLEKLIAKKEAVRNGTLQRLITGRVRLEGFSGEWVEINMAKHSKLKARIGWQGLTTSEYLTSGDAILVTGTDFCEGRVKWDGCHFVSWDRYQQDPNIQIVNGDVLLTKDGTIGKVALVDSLNRPATLNSGVFVIRPLKNAYSSRFLYYVLASSVFQEFLDKLVAGSTIVHLYQKDLVAFEFMAPPTYEEQEAIASVLYDMDGEIQTLKEKLDKYKLIKQGMMSELLTGRIRLIDKEDA